MDCQPIIRQALSVSIAGEAQLDERPLNKWKVVGSNPASCTAARSVGEADDSSLPVWALRGSHRFSFY